VPNRLGRAEDVRPPPGTLPGEKDDPLDEAADGVAAGTCKTPGQSQRHSPAALQETPHAG